MNVRISISAEEYNRLKSQRDMLGRIAAVAGKYSEYPNASTYECVVAMETRLRNATKKIRDHKRAGGEFLR